MNYRVRWAPVAEDELTSLWLGAVDRNIVTQAAQAIERRLSTNAENEGESRSARLRILFSAPLAATYEVEPRAREAYVVHVWRYRVGS